MEKHGAEVEVIRAVDHDIATGVWPDMRDHGWTSDDWPMIFEKVLASDIFVLAGPIWLGDNSSVMGAVPLLRTRRRLSDHRQRGRRQALRSERPVHIAAHRLHHPAPGGRRLDRRGWPGPVVSGPWLRGPENDFTNRNTTFMTWNLMHLAWMLRAAGGLPAHGNIRSGWDAGCRYDFANPEYR